MVQEEIEGSKPGVERFAHVGAHSLDTLLFLSGPNRLATTMIPHVKAIYHVVLDVLKALTVPGIDKWLEMTRVIMQEQVCWNHRQRKNFLQKGNFVFIAFIDYMLIGSQDFPSHRVQCKLPSSRATGQDLTNGIFFLHWHDLSYSYMSFMGRPFSLTWRAGSTEASKTRWTPKCPSNATASTGEEGGKRSKGLVTLTICFAGKSTLNSMTSSGLRRATAYPSRACRRWSRKEVRPQNMSLSSKWTKWRTAASCPGLVLALRSRR